MKVKLKDIAEFSKGNQINGSDLIDGAEYIYLNGGINPSGKWNDYNVEAGTITISEGGNSCGYVNFINEPFWCGAHCYYLYNIDGNEKYLYYALKSQESRLMRLRSGAWMPNIKKSDLGEFYFTYENDLKKQEDIVKKFDNVENCIFLLQEELKKIELLIKSRFIEMFGDPVINPMNWKKTVLGKNAILLNGRAYKQEELLDSGKYPVLRVGNFFSNRGWYYSNLELEEDKYCDNGDLLYAWSASFGSQIWNGGKVIYHYHIWKLIVGEAYNKSFLCKLLNYVTESLMGKTHGIAMMHLTKSGMEKTQFIVPPIELQNQFVAFVQQVNKSELAVKASLEKLETLKKSLMQQYFG